jgi:serine/threonine protein kinase
LYKYTLTKDYQNDFEEFLINISAYFNSVDKNIHKARNELKVIEHANIQTIVKSFKVPHIINKVAYTHFKDSKAKKSYEYSLKIGDFTPKPIGYIEFYSKGLLDKSYFVSERFDYDFTIREPLLDDTFENKEDILKAFARFTYELHENNILHQDYSPGNILIKKENSEFIFKIVDINRMQFIPLDLKKRMKNFSKLWINDTDLQVVVNEYAKYASIDQTQALEKALYYSHKLKNRINMKKRLKGIPVVD